MTGHTLTLMVLPTAWGLRNASAFNLKAQALLAASGLAHETVEALPAKGPKGKLPALVDGERTIGDSALIQAHLAAAHGFDPDAALDARQRAESEAYRRLAEEHLYFVNLHVRWVQRPRPTRDAFFGTLPAPVRAAVFAALRRQVKRTLWGQGIGRHSVAEILDFGRQDIDALAARLDGAPFFHGERPTSIDAALYPQILNTYAVPYDTPLRRHAAAIGTLVDYCARCDAAFFGP